MSKKSFIDKSFETPPENEKPIVKRTTKNIETEDFKITSVLVKPKRIKDFRIRCRELDLKIQDELDKMLENWLKEHKK